MKALIEIFVGFAVLAGGTHHVSEKLKREVAQKFAEPVSLTRRTTQLTDDNKWWE